MPDQRLDLVLPERCTDEIGDFVHPAAILRDER